MKLRKLLPIILLAGTLTSCNGTFFGIDTTVHNSWCKETDEYIVFPQCVYIKKSKSFVTNLDDFNEFYSADKNDETLSDEYSLVRDGFYSSAPGHQNLDKIDLNEIDNAIWEYAKCKSVKSKFPYLIEGKCKEINQYIYFNVNVNNGSTFKGGSFNNMTIVDSTLNRINKTSLEIEQLEHLDKAAISSFDEQHLMFVKKNKKDLICKDLNTNIERKLVKIHKSQNIYNCGSYLLVENHKNSSFDYSLCKL